MTPDAWTDAITGVRCAIVHHPVPTGCSPDEFWCGYVELPRRMTLDHPVFARSITGGIDIDGVEYVGFDTAHASDFDADGKTRWTIDAVRTLVTEGALAASWRPEGGLAAESPPDIVVALLAYRRPDSDALLAVLEKRVNSKSVIWSWSDLTTPTKHRVYCRKAASLEAAVAALRERGVPCPPARVLATLEAYQPKPPDLRGFA